MSIHLSNDSNTSLQNHIDEFASRVGLLIFFWVLVSIPWFLNIDTILPYFIERFKPCDGDCLNLYEPAKWSETRFMISGLLGLMTIFPLVLQQIWVFFKPGLMKSERKMLRSILILLPIIMALTTYITLFHMLPYIFTYGNEIHIEMGFTANYDVISIVSIAMSIIWVEFLTLVGITILSCAGITGNLNSSNKNWWRIRVYGFISLIVLLSFYGDARLGPYLLFTCLTIIEVAVQPWYLKKPKTELNAKVVYDKYGEVRKIGIISCDCAAGDSNEKDQEVLYQNNLCSNVAVQEETYKIIRENTLTDVILINCNEVSESSQLYQNFKTITNRIHICNDNYSNFIHNLLIK